MIRYQRPSTFEPLHHMPLSPPFPVRTLARLIFPFLPCLAAVTAAASGQPVDRFGSFEELPLTAIEPRGWLRQYLVNQRDGLTGHLETAGYPFDTIGWAGATIPNNTSIEDWWPYEQNAYWVDGMIRCGRLLRDDFLIAKARRSIDYVLAHPAPNGYLGPLLTPTSAEMNRWIHVVFFRALMAEFSATGDRRIVEAVRRHYQADDITFAGSRDSLNIEAMLWAYRLTGDGDLRRRAVRAWTTSNADPANPTAAINFLRDAPVREHGVTYDERAKLGALMFLATGDRDALAVSEAAFRKIDKYYHLIGGVNVSSEWLEPVTASEACENCDISDFTWSAGYLLMATGDPHYADEIERAAFNAAPGSVSWDFKALQYFSAPNQVICTHASFPRSGGSQMCFAPNPGTECCPGNVNRCLPNFAARLWMRGADRGLAAVLYSPSRVTAEVGPHGEKVTIEEDTTYPFSEIIRFRIQAAQPVRFPLRLRIPGWCTDASVEEDGHPAGVIATAGSFAVLDREFVDGATVTLRLPQRIRFTPGPESTVSIERGPLVYSLKIAEQWQVDATDRRSTPEFPAYDVRPAGPWNYALVLDPTGGAAGLDVVVKNPGEQPWSAATAPIEIRARARRVRGWEIVPQHEVQTEHWDVIRDPKTNRVTNWVKNGFDRKEGTFLFTPPVPPPAVVAANLEGLEETVTLIPFGCAKLRITYFPVARAAVQRLRVMPLGDSITAGSYGAGQDGVGGYRAELVKGCAAVGLAVSFVGSLNDPADAPFDAHHEGHRAWRID